MCQVKQSKNLASAFPGLVYTNKKQNYNSRSARKIRLDIPFCQPSLMGCSHGNTNALKIGTDSKRKNQLRN